MKDWFSPLFLFDRSGDKQLRRHLGWKEAEIEMLRERVPKQRIVLDNEERGKRSRRVLRRQRADHALLEVPDGAVLNAVQRNPDQSTPARDSRS